MEPQDPESGDTSLNGRAEGELRAVLRSSDHRSPASSSSISRRSPSTTDALRTASPRRARRRACWSLRSKRRRVDSSTSIRGAPPLSALGGSHCLWSGRQSPCLPLKCHAALGETDEPISPLRTSNWRAPFRGAPRTPDHCDDTTALRGAPSQRATEAAMQGPCCQSIAWRRRRSPRSGL